MKIALWGKEEEVIKKIYKNYKLKKKEKIFNEDNQFKYLIYALEKNNNVLLLDKVENYNEVDLYIYIDFPDIGKEFVKKAFDSKKNNFLITLENQIIHPENFKRKNLSLFNKVFTWDDELIDNIKYFKYSITYSLNSKILNLNQRDNLCCMIAVNKVINYNKSLYKKRLECIKWFENNYYKDFSLYGLNWDRRYVVGPKFLRIINRINIITKFLSYNFRSYKGQILGSTEAKINILRKYKFSIVFENADNLKGYITEKIFHCFFALTVPIYYGATNISVHIPKECFINMRNFKNYNDLYKYIKNLDTRSYKKYISNIKSFLSSKKFKPFTNQHSVQVVLNEISKIKVND
jgi:hypothetical protein